MKNLRIYLFLLIFASILPSISFCQTWEFIKEHEGVKLFTRKEPGENLKIFKGVTEINESIEKVFVPIEDVNHTEWWDKNLTQIQVLRYEHNKRAQYYLIYDMPWPFKNRDLYVDVTSSINQTTGELKVIAIPLSNGYPEKKGFVRIKKYRQVWTLKPVNNRTHVELEFYVDPDENLPNWLLNMVLVDSPFNTIISLRQLVEKKQTLNTH